MTPNIFGCVTIRSVGLSICRCSLVLYSLGFGVNCVELLLSGLITRLLSFPMCVIVVDMFLCILHFS